MGCAAARLVIGLILGLLARMEPVLEALGLDWERAATPLLAHAPISQGTGFFVSRDGDFVTADHVLGNCRRPAVETPGGVSPATVVARSSRRDLAVLRTERPPLAAALLLPRRPFPVRERITITRYRSCGGLASRGIVAGHATAMRFGSFGALAVTTEQPIMGGNSGSPVIDTHGLLLGMIVARFVHESTRALAVDATTIMAFLDEHEVAFETAPPMLFLLPERSPASAVPYTFPVVCLR